MLGDERPEVTGGDGEGLSDGAGKTKGKPGPKPRKLAEKKESPGLDMAAVFELISRLDENQQKNMLAFATELKKPTAKELREEADNEKKEERIKGMQAARLEAAKKEEERKAGRITGCSHSTYNEGTGVSKHAFRAQVHAPDGVKPYFVPTCQICWYQTPKILATVEMLTNGVNLDKYLNLDIAKLAVWAEQSQVA